MAGIGRGGEDIRFESSWILNSLVLSGASSAVGSNAGSSALPRLLADAAAVGGEDGGNCIDIILWLAAREIQGPKNDVRDSNFGHASKHV